MILNIIYTERVVACIQSRGKFFLPFLCKKRKNMPAAKTGDISAETAARDAAARHAADRQENRAFDRRPAWRRLLQKRGRYTPPRPAKRRGGRILRTKTGFLRRRKNNSPRTCGGCEAMLAGALAAPEAPASPATAGDMKTLTGALRPPFGSKTEGWRN